MISGAIKMRRLSEVYSELVDGRVALISKIGDNADSSMSQEMQPTL